MDRVRRLTNENLRGAKGRRDKARVRAIQLDLHRAARSELNVTTGRHTHREASDREICAVQGDGVTWWGHNSNAIEGGSDVLTVIHEAQAVRRGARDTRLARRTRRTRSQRTRGARGSRGARAARRARRTRSQRTRPSRRARGAQRATEFQGAQDGSRVEAPGGDSVASHDIEGVGVESEGDRFVDGFDGESLCGVRGLSHDRLEMSNGGGDAVLIPIELDENRGACG